LFSKKHQLALGVVACIGLIVLMGCSAQTPQGESGTTGGSGGGTQQASVPIAQSYAEWIQMYPDEYASYNIDKIDLNGKNGGHNHMRTLLETYDKPMPKLDASCLSCKTTASNDLYERYGEAYLAMSWDDVKEDVEAYYDCGLCHVNSQDMEIKPSLVYYNNLARDTFIEEDIRTQACGQCHNGLALYRSKIGGSEATWDSYDPYRYGTDGDALYRSALEDSAGASPDEETGAVIVRGTSENDMEVFVNSNHDSLGISCVDCHMPSTTKADGSSYVNHNASGSPLENPDALEYCLSCHKAQGINSQAAMVDLVKGKQADTAALINTVENRLDGIKQRLIAAKASGAGDSQALDTARSNYSKANFFVQFYALMLPDGTKVVHNPKAVDDYLNRSIKLLDEADLLLDGAGLP
jgi:nitrite reductase (cytochrome c-552)